MHSKLNAIDDPSLLGLFILPCEVYRIHYIIIMHIHKYARIHVAMYIDLR